MRGFLGAFSRRVGRRPLRWFLLLWGLATLVWLAGGAIHFRLERWPDVPPAREAVPYADFLPGGAFERSVHWPLPLEPQRLPEHDPSLLRPDRCVFQVWPADAVT